MSKSALFTVVLLCAAGVAVAQAENPRKEHTRPQRQVQVDESAKDTPQERRAAVRAALDQREAKEQGTEVQHTRVRRQLSPQERQELRQQLRQQRRDAERP